MTALYTWGDATAGALGHERYDDITREPRRLINSKKYQQVSCGEGYSLAVDHAGHMFGWGTGPSVFDSKAPFPIPTEKMVKKVFAGSKHAACIDVDGDMYTWGTDSAGWFKGGGRMGHANKEKEIQQPKYVLLVIHPL